MYDNSTLERWQIVTTYQIAGVGQSALKEIADMACTEKIDQNKIRLTKVKMT